MGEDRWCNLDVWRLADNLAMDVYEATREFPREEIYGLTAQLRRAALSVPTNLVEGYSRRGDRELRHFVNIALGSLAETKYLLHFASRLGFLEPEVHATLASSCETLGKRLWRFYEAVGAAESRKG
ncbi:MAG: four helix bundle protein [Deltaproteobacteria bacterium]|nr:four helix bundle protein [Deltaproteobacteria bacterium]